ncbi:MAG: DUF2442 domain-containing protein [Chloroflexota bacterium]|nr:DUF2442 domain-containing protein [Chloroflexota bacterium]
MVKAPEIHDERNAPTGLKFSEEYVIITLADERTIGMPLYFFPWLHSATDEQRRAYQLGAWSVYWEELDEGIDLIAMISGMYIKAKKRPETETPTKEATT